MLTCKRNNHGQSLKGPWDNIRSRTVVFFDRDGNATSRLIPVHICWECGAWLSLGPSDESKVALEVRAAEIAADWDDDATWWDGFLSLGMCSPEGQHAPLIEADIARGTKFQRDLDDYLAGHLARCITEHGGR